MSFPTHVRGDARKRLGRKWGLASAAKWQPQSPDRETLRKRALDNRRGTVVRYGTTYHGDGRETQWSVRHAIRGRTDQYELVANGRVFCRAGRRKLPKGFKP